MKIPESGRQMTAAGLVLATAAFVGTGLMAWVWAHSEPLIERNRQELVARSLAQVMPGGYIDERTVHSRHLITDSAVEPGIELQHFYRGRRAGVIHAVAVRVSALRGYAGPIELLVGINRALEVTGVRVVSHRETPGLGDAIERRRSRWLDQFLGKSLNDPSERDWRVRRDGGVFDQLTGATITPRAVVAGVHGALRYVARHRDELFGSVTSTQREDTS